MPRPDLYADWAPAYPPTPHNALMEAEQRSMLALMPAVAGRRVLDAGCGTGRYLLALTALGATVFGVDLSPAMLRQARRDGGRVARADLARLPLGAETFDLVLSGLCVIDVPSLLPVTAEWARVLRRDGVVVYSTLHPRGRELGWTRTYETPHGRRALPAHWHTAADHERACRLAGFAIETIDEPALQPGGDPVALVVRARRRG